MVYGWKNVQARHFNFQVHIQLILIHFIDCALHRARWRRFFKNEGQCLQLIRASCKQIYQNVCVLQSTCYNYTCILFPQGKADWLNNHVQRWLRRNHRHQIRLVIHFMHGPTIVLAIVRARPFTRNGFTMHGFMNVFLFMRGHLYILYGSQSLRQENFKLSQLFQKACFHMRAVTCMNLLHTWQLFGCRSLATMHACMAFLLEFIMQNSHMKSCFRIRHTNSEPRHHHQPWEGALPKCHLCMHEQGWLWTCLEGACYICKPELAGLLDGAASVEWSSFGTTGAAGTVLTSPASSCQ